MALDEVVPWPRPKESRPRLGFRLTRIDRDIFTPEAGYPPVFIAGIRLLDRAWLELPEQERADREKSSEPRGASDVRS